jgi:DNA topoisomerase-1
MPNALVVVESPAKAKTINKILGKDYVVMASMGHVRDLPQKDLGIDIDGGFQPKYQTIRGRGKLLQKLKSAAKSAGKLILATDPDREGEAIAWHVVQALKHGGEIERVMFNEITERAVTEAVANPSEIDLRKVDAQQARRVLDRLVGYKVSPLLWKTVHGGLSAGRVQSVALRMICEREAEIDIFLPQEYWTVDAMVKADDTDTFKSRLVGYNGGKPQIENQELADQIVADLKAAASSEAGYQIGKITKKAQRRNPAPPFITSTLQQEASRRLRFTARKTMMVAQQLYEGIEIGGETTGLITYMRTDSTRLAAEAVAAARSYISTRFGEEYLPKSPRVYRKGKGAQDAHEAVRPTGIEHPPDSLRSYLTPDQAKLYKLVWDRFIACQMAPAVFDRTSVDITAGNCELRATGSVLKFPGFTALYTEGTDDDQEEAEGLLPATLVEGERITLVELLPEQHFTKPPPRFSEPTLVKELESLAIGRPSTYAQIISTLQDKDYVSRDRGRFSPTELGKTVSGILVKAFPDVFNVDFTARMEGELDQIENGSSEWVKVVEDFYVPFSKDLDKAESSRKELKASLQEITDKACEKCGEMMVIKWGRNGRFMACAGFPECRNTLPLGEPDTPEVTGEKCEKCDSDMIIRTGRSGRFLACSGYPDCKNTRPISLGIQCVRDGCDGHLVERSSRRGKTFYGCSKYPQCEFAAWDRPLNQECPMCEGPFLAEHTGRKGDDSVRCLKCKHKVERDTSEEEETDT